MLFKKPLPVITHTQHCTSGEHRKNERRLIPVYFKIKATQDYFYKQTP